MFELFGTDIEFTVSMSLDPWVSFRHLSGVESGGVWMEGWDRCQNFVKWYAEFQKFFFGGWGGRVRGIFLRGRGDLFSVT